MKTEQMRFWHQITYSWLYIRNKSPVEREDPILSIEVNLLKTIRGLRVAYLIKQIQSINYFSYVCLMCIYRISGFV